uniref:Mcl1_mid domain-containing protein n=1 Tax=Macrostomum lignano TaxID=282301 RepID=A0A1I8IHH5_9PLAT
EANAYTDVNAIADADADADAASAKAKTDADTDTDESLSDDSVTSDAPNPFEPAALSSDYALPLRQVQDTLGDATLSAAYRALWWRGDAWAACLLLCEWRPDSLDHVCQSGQGHLLHLVGVVRSARHFVACVDQSIGESATRDLRRCLPTVPLFRGSPCQDVGLGKWLRAEAPNLSGAPMHYALTTHEVLLDARLPVRPPRGDWSRRRLLLSGGWLLAAPGDGGPQWSLAGCRGCCLVQDADNGTVVEVTLAGGDTVMIGGQSAVTWKQAICTALVRGGAGGSGSGATSKILTLLVTEHGLALGAEVPGVWTIRSIGFDPHYPTYLTLRLRPPTTWLICLGSAEERNRLGRLLRHLLPRLPLRRLPPGRAGGLRASARALTLLCEQTLP